MRSRATRLSILFALLGCSTPQAETRTRPLPPTPAPPALEETLAPKSEAPSAAPVERPADRAPSLVASLSTPAEPAAPVAQVAQDDAAPAPQKSAPTAQDDGETVQAPPGVLGYIAGAPLSASDLLVEWHSIAGRDVFLVVEKLVTTRLALAEAQRIGLRLQPDVVELRIAEDTRRFSQEIAKNNPDLSVEDFIRSRLGVAPTTYFARMRQAAIRQMIAERAVRSWTLSNEWARARMILVNTVEEANALLEQARGGADFATLARENSLDDTAEDGGLIPFLVRQEESPLAAAAFSAEVGELVGPVSVSGRQVVLVVESRTASAMGDWPAVQGKVEASLASEPIRDAEFLYWKLTMEQRYPIDLGGLKQLLGIDG